MKKDEKLVDEDEEIIEVHEALKISDGAHSGIIDNVVHEKRGDEGQYDYLDLYINLKDDNDNEATIKTGFPFYISESSGLGMILEKAGMKLKAGDTLKLSAIKDTLIGKKLIFQTFTEDKFARIMNKTIKFD